MNVTIFGAAEYPTLEWAGWFNDRRLLEPIANVRPSEAVELCCAISEARQMAE